MNSDDILKKILNELRPDYTFKKEIPNFPKERFSNVYLVKNKNENRDELLKVIDTKFILDSLEKGDIVDIQVEYEKIKDEFSSKVNAYLSFSHPNIVKIYGIRSIKYKESNLEIPYCLMEYVDGRSLKDIMKDGSMTKNRVMKISEDILSALSLMHKRKTKHRDLNPGSIMIDENGRTVLAYLGLTKYIYSVTGLRASGEIMGTPKYMAPELFEDEDKADSGTDLYAYGAILFEMLTGKPPFDKENARELMIDHQKEPIPSIGERNPNLPVGFQKIIEKAMAKKKEDRYRNADDMLSDLRKIK